MAFAAQAFVILLEAYAAAGFLFAAFFVTLGVERIDSQASGAGWGFRLLVFPGAAALWPLLLRRWRQGGPDPAVERNPHRDAAGAGQPS